MRQISKSDGKRFLSPAVPVQILFKKRGGSAAPMASKKATIADIAKRAGVSAATASRVMSNSPYPVRESLRAKVLDAAAQLNYKPNRFSQLLKGGASREVAVLVPSITNPFYSQLVGAVERECLYRGYTLIICSSQNSPELELRHLETMERRQVDGVLLSSIHLNDAFLNKLSSSAKAFVLLDQVPPAYEADCVSFDFFEAGHLATQYLLSCGHRDIAFISGPLDRYSRRLYLDGYRKALRDAGLHPSSRRILLYSGEGGAPDADPTMENSFACGQALGRMLLRGEYLPDAVVAVNDMMAIGAIKLLEQQGVQVPNDLSVIGFDDISVSALVSPALTTIAQPAAETGRLAAHMLLDRLEEKEVREGRILLQPALIERESVRRLHKKLRR